MYPKELKYTKDHEWIRYEDGVYVVGITEYATDQLGDVTYVDLPDLGADFNKGDSAAAVESVKAASDVYTPVGGHVCEINDTLHEKPELVNKSPHDDGWFFKLEKVRQADLSDLLDAAAYEAYLETLH